MPLEMYVREDRRIVEIWLTGAEKQDAAVQEKLKSLYNIGRKNTSSPYFCPAREIYTRKRGSFSPTTGGGVRHLRFCVGSGRMPRGRLVRRRRESSVFWLPDGSCKARAGMVQCCCGEGCGQSSHAQEEYTVAEAFAIAGYVRISVDDEAHGAFVRDACAAQP